MAPRIKGIEGIAKEKILVLLSDLLVPRGNPAFQTQRQQCITWAQCWRQKKSAKRHDGEKAQNITSTWQKPARRLANHINVVLASPLW